MIFVSFSNNTTGATSGTGTALLILPEILCSPLCFVGFMLFNLLFSVYYFLNHCFSFCLPFLLAIVLPVLWITVSDYPFCYIQTFIIHYSVNVTNDYKILWHHTSIDNILMESDVNRELISTLICYFTSQLFP